MALSPTHFERALADWVQGCLEMSNADQLLEAVALDGNTLRGTLQPHARAVYLLALLDQRTGCVLSQTHVDAKTNEHKGVLEILKTLVLEGRVITGDAIFCQREVCGRGGHYLFVVKDNQPTLKEAIAAELKAAFSPGDRTTAGCG